MDRTGEQRDRLPAADETARRVATAAGLDPDALAREVQYAPQPRLALARAADLVGGASAIGGLTREQRIALWSVLGGSGHLSRVLTAEAAWQSWLRREVRDGPGVGELPPLPQESASPTESAALLRRFRQKAFLRIGARDLWGVAALEETLASLTATAELAIDYATRLARRELETEYGPLEL
ncbi:MAG TPA: hypothetical protein VEI94_13660, partial [Candidatus Bathyarchaeia archaeon]|nr:hypothetical protein [Candidatus Bathyarchaeia archaeon]